MKSRATIALSIALVFSSGVALGVFGNQYYDARRTANEEKAKSKGKRMMTPEEWRKAYLAGMKKQLTLSDQQVTDLNRIMDETRTLTDELSRRHQPEYQEIQRSQREKIRALFDDEQRLKYDAMRAAGNKNKSDNKNKPN